MVGIATDTLWLGWNGKFSTQSLYTFLEVCKLPFNVANLPFLIVQGGGLHQEFHRTQEVVTVTPPAKSIWLNCKMHLFQCVNTSLVTWNSQASLSNVFLSILEELEAISFSGKSGHLAGDCYGKVRGLNDSKLNFVCFDAWKEVPYIPSDEKHVHPSGSKHIKLDNQQIQKTI